MSSVFLRVDNCLSCFKFLHRSDQGSSPSLNSKQLSSNLKFSPNSFDSLLNIADNLKGLTLIPGLDYADLPDERKANAKDFEAPFPVREISLVYHRPYAKLRLITALAEEIKETISPLLHTSKLKSSDKMIAKM